MTLTLELTRDEEARLSAAARERGAAPDEVIRTLMHEHLPQVRPFHETATPEEWSHAWRAWAAGHGSPSPGLSEAAVSRDSIYEGRG
jgi:hypothetical protein